MFSAVSISQNGYFTFTFAATASANSFDALNVGITWAGILTLVPLEMFLPIFSARFFSKKVPLAGFANSYSKAIGKME